jgi:acyl dehydratase
MSGANVITDEMRTAVGVESEPATHDVERGAIRRFADAIGDVSPPYRDEEAARNSRHGGLIAPPTFLRSLPAGPHRVELRSPYPEVLDGGSEWEYFEPVRAGDRITVTSRIVELKERSGRLGPMLFVTTETRYVNQSGRVAATQRGTIIHYRPEAGGR